MERALLWLLLVVLCRSRAVPIDSDDDYSSSAQLTPPENFDCEGGYVQGATWITNDSCTQCTCANGTIFCDIVETCCTWKDESTGSLKIYPHGKSIQSGCSTCTCDRGRVSCPSRSCPKWSSLCKGRLPGPTKDNTCLQPHCVEDECGCPQLLCHQFCVVGDGIHKRKYAHTETWHNGECSNQYSCLFGMPFDSMPPSGKLNCSDVTKRDCPGDGRETILPGECCPSWICDDEEPCTMTSWSPWTECSKSCDMGISTRHRRIAAQPTSTPNGMEDVKCPPTFEARHCFRLPCFPPDPLSGEPSPTAIATPTATTTATETWPWINDRTVHYWISVDECKSAHKVKVKHCGRKRCHKYGLHNAPVYQKTLSIVMVCKGKRQWRLFESTEDCGCLPGPRRYP